MSRYIKAYTGFNKNKMGKVIWCRACTQSNLSFDALERCIFGEIRERGYDILTMKEIKEWISYHKDRLDVFDKNTKEYIHNSLQELISEVEKHKMHYVLFKIG